MKQVFKRLTFKDYLTALALLALGYAWIVFAIVFLEAMI